MDERQSLDAMEMDATDYLFSTEANRRHLLKALEDFRDPTKRIYMLSNGEENEVPQVAWMERSEIQE